jgi:gliding motility-associated-like protein
MTVRISCNYKKFLLSLLILFGIHSATVLSQKNLSGNLNQPKAHVVSILPSPTDRVIVDDITGFNVNDTILLIQMQGVKILLSPYGNLQNKLGEPGMYEFLIIQTVNGGTKEIVFKNNILKNYDPAGNIQVVRVPYYNSAVVSGILYCDPWNPTAKNGGVMAIITGRSLKLSANIDVSGRGFSGGKDTIGYGICWNTNTTLYGQDYYPWSFKNAGYKGEGVANFTEFSQPLFPNYTKGKGKNWTGGGGGNGRFSGGGGGSNRGAGGIGGKEDCFPQSPGGTGGLVADHASLPGRIYLGGGGGASTSFSGLVPPGGYGGGIVIIVTDTIIGNGGKILSNGGNGGTALVNGGAGGGGGGGSIALSVNSYGSRSLEFSVLGGNGGNNPGTFGEGGGGGGGLLWVSTSFTGNVTPTITGGLPGNYPSSTANGGGIGEVRSGFKANLNGFLFNSIRSSVSGNQIDSVCSNMIPPKITGTKPVGGTGPYTYLWEKSYNNAAWTTLVNDSDPTNFTPTLADAVTPTGSVWFRRTITDSSPSALVDISKPVRFVVQPAVKNNIVGPSDTICFAQNPPAFSSMATLQGGNGIYAFRWEVSINNILFNTPSNTYNTEAYTPPPVLEKTSWYRRTVSSGICIDSTAIAKITVLDTIKNNKVLNSSPDICFGMSFVNLTATTNITTQTLAGGDNSFRFKWESSINGGGWGTAPGISNGSGYNPAELPQKIPFNEYRYRRVVYSGNNNVCMNTSNAVLLKDFPVIANNSITRLTQPICSGTIPPKLVGSQPVNGDGVVYTYIWQDSTKLHTWSDIAGAASIDYQPPSLTDTTSYRRVVFSSACSDISKSTIAIVHKPVINTISLIASGTDTTICNGAIPDRLKGLVATGGSSIPGSYTYQWILSADNGTTWNPVATGGNGLSYQPPALIAPATPAIYLYRRMVSSGACMNVPSSSTIRITVLPSISNNNVSDNQNVCYNTIPDALIGTAPVGGNGSYTYYWEQSTNNGISWGPASGPGIINASGYSPPTITIKTLYRRTVYSGIVNCCTNISNVITINIYPLPTAAITSTAPLTICQGSKVPLVLSITGASPWTVVYNENSNKITAPPVTIDNTTILASPVPGAALTTFTFSLFFVRDNNGCFATSLSGSRQADVYKVPAANAGPDQIVCGPTVTLSATPSVGTGVWYYPASVVASTPNNVTVKVTVDSTFTGANISHKFYWEETNWNCKNKDSLIVTFDKRIGLINAGPDTSLYSFDNIFHMVAAPVKQSEGQKGLWSLINGTGSFDDPNSNMAVVTSLSKGINTFLWTVENGKCSKSDQVRINVYNIEIPEGFSPNNDPGGYNNTFIIKGLDLPNQTAELTIVNGAGTEVFSTSNRNGQKWSDWDGTNSKGYDLPEGTYYYLLKITSKGNSQVFKKSGFIVLKRY